MPVTSRFGEITEQSGVSFSEWVVPIPDVIEGDNRAKTTLGDHRELPLTMSLLQACKMVGLGKTKMQELVNSGELEIAKVGGRTLVLTDSIIALVERHRVSRGR